MLKFYGMVIPEYSWLDSKSMGPILETQRGIIFNSFVLKYTAFVFLELNLWNHYTLYIFRLFIYIYFKCLFNNVFKEIKYELSWMLQNNFQGREMLFCNKETEARIPCNPNDFVKTRWKFTCLSIACWHADDNFFRWMFNTSHLFMKNHWTMFLHFKGNLIQLHVLINTTHNLNSSICKNTHYKKCGIGGPSNSRIELLIKINM